MEEKKLEEIEKRHKAARRGPYKTWPKHTVIDPNGQAVASGVLLEGDRVFLAGAWQDVKELLEEVRDLRKRHLALEEEAAKIRAMPKKKA